MLYNIQYSSPNTNYIKYFMDVKSTLAKKAIDGDLHENQIKQLDSDDGKRILQGVYTKIEKEFIKGKEIIDTTNDYEKCLSEKGVNLLNSMTLNSNGVNILVSFDINITANIFTSFGRGSFVTLNNVHLTKETQIEVKNKFNPYGNEGYSFAIITDDYKIAFAVTNPLRAQKSGAILKVIEYTENKINIDDASKYANIDELIKGVSV